MFSSKCCLTVWESNSVFNLIFSSIPLSAHGYPTKKNTPLIYILDIWFFIDQLSIFLRYVHVFFCCIVECINCIGEDYRGPMDHTESGKECQRWDLDDPHKHLYHPKRWCSQVHTHRYTLTSAAHKICASSITSTCMHAYSMRIHYVLKGS